MHGQPESASRDISEYLAPVWSRRWLILAIVVLATAATYVYYSSKPKEYTALARLYVKSSPIEQALTNSLVLPNGDRDTQNQAALLQSRAVAVAVAQRLKTKEPPAGLLGSITATAASGQDFVTIVAVRGSAADAARVANGFANAFIDLRARSNRGRIQQAIRNAETQLASQPSTTAGDAQRRVLRSQIGRLQAVLGLPAADAQLVDPAAAPGRPSAPKPRRDAAFAFVVALLFAVGLTLLLEQMDRRLKHIEDVERLYAPLPVLTVLPHVGNASPSNREGVAVSDTLRESFRTLRMSIRLASLEEPLRTLVVSSAVPGEGKTTVVRNLALTYREAGLRVAIVETDLRRPGLAPTLGLDKEPGVTEVISGDADLTEALQSIHVRDSEPAAMAVGAAGAGATNGDEARVDAEGGLVALTSGQRPANPPAVLSSARLREILDELSGMFDLVIIDTPPVLAVSDAVPLFSYADGVLLVIRMELTTRDAARRTVDLLGRIPDARILGMVANEVDDRAIGGGYAYYAYTGR